MKIIVFMLLQALAVGAVAAEIKWDQETVRTILQDEIERAQAMAQQPTLVLATVAQNDAQTPMALIMERDQEWVNEGPSLSMQRAMQASSAGVYLRDFLQNNDNYTEVFLADLQGANVAASPLTTDYWQGDEDKWRKIIEDKQAVFVGPMMFDESSRSNIVQISVPVQAQGQNQGVMIIGVRLSHVLSKQLEYLK